MSLKNITSLIPTPTLEHRYESAKLELQKELKLVQSHVAENVMRPAAQFPKDLISSVETYHPWIMLLSCHTDYHGNLILRTDKDVLVSLSRRLWNRSKKLEIDRPTCLVLNTFVLQSRNSNRSFHIT